MAEGQVYFAKSDGVLVLQFEGEIRYTLAPPLDRFLDIQFADGTLQSVCVDLNRVTAIDSTGIGLLAKTAKLLKHNSEEKPVLFSSNDEINELLGAVCLDSYCIIVQGIAEPVSLESLPEYVADESEMADTILEAHRILCELSEDNRAQFQNVVDALERERH
ncbi:Serine-protein kinase RsbW [Marinobacterium lacunae]|uniref:Serine-protein kinase RsbW n=1 Tax=Marinobacterium lacunae TaxID=1232683 RepID=A0A081FYW3_9GAMM|nr:STAS domain-containing protein [Marinobacterium lacunae]KEA63718.1 Serine-protein kinase RsbW [Marinobacterium lacunae]